MGRFNASEADNYGSSSGNSFFSLKNDGEVARVRFMYNDMNDVVGYAVHEVTVDDKRRYVSCLRDYNEPKSKCPFCAANNFQKAKMFVPIYDIDDEEVKLWDRGKNFFPKISSLCARYVSGDKPLVSHTFDVERHGKPHDTSTTYEIYETGSDNTRLADLPEVPEVLGSIVLDKTADDMNYYLDNGYFPNKDGAPTRSSNRYDSSEPVRRTPSRRGESF